LKIVKYIRLFLFVTISSQLIVSSCATIDLYEKNVAIPGHEWKSSHQPEFTFVIKDTSSTYQVFFIIRHSEKYNYNNIWINLYSQPPGDTLRKVPYELQLATNEKGWLASGLDDIYEHRIGLTDEIKLKAGEYKLRLENIMREDPLMHVLSIGLRVEKKQ
jgi:gliding motility-associated lipoprotein GldH